jgi:hypothetical protein
MHALIYLNHKDVKKKKQQLARLHAQDRSQKVFNIILHMYMPSHNIHINYRHRKHCITSLLSQKGLNKVLLGRIVLVPMNNAIEAYGEWS